MVGWRGRGKLTHLFHYVWREDSGCEGSTEDVRKFLVKSTNPHLLKVPVGADDGLARLSGFGLPWQGSKKTRPTFRLRPFFVLFPEKAPLSIV